MHLDCVCDPQLPKLAWLAVLEKNVPAIRLIHGEWVETDEHFAFEGAWGSNFDATGFDRCETVVGSGFVVRDDRVVFCPPSHSLARLHVLPQGDSLFVSNSFVFCLTGAGRTLRPDYALYFRDFQSIIRGLKKHRTRIPLDQGVMDLLYVDNLAVGSDLKTERVPKPEAPVFTCYEEYHEYVNEIVEHIGANLTSASRTIRYEPISTISSGYDSSASAVFAKRIGSTTAITFPKARGSEESDSGAEIGKHLGYSIIEGDRLAYQQRTDFPEAEFVVGGTAGDGGDVIFSSLQGLLPRKLLVTGFTGDAVWNPNGYPNRFMIKDALGGSLMEEFRLRIGFVHLPLPIIGCQRGPELAKISLSSFMRPWATGEYYDKPIPRRILEEAGVPRACFGQNKKAVGARFFDGPNRGPEDLRVHLSPSSYRDYQQYFTDHYQPNKQETFYFVMSKLRMRLDKAYTAFNKYIGPRVGLMELKAMALRHYGPWIGKNWLLFHWAVEKVRQRYEKSSQRNFGVHPPKKLVIEQHGVAKRLTGV